MNKTQNQLTIEISTLKAALTGFGKIINKGSTLPVLACLRLTTTAHGTVHLKATNLEDYLTFAFDSGSSSLPVDALIPYATLTKIIKGYSAKEILTFVQEGQELSIVHPVSSSSLKQKVESLSIDEWPQEPKIQPTDKITVGDDFKKAITEALECVTEDDSRYILQHPFVDVSDSKAHYVIATDGKQLFSANSFHLKLKNSLIMPGRKFLLWSGFLDDGDWIISISTAPKQELSWIRIESDRWSLITRPVEGEYPNWRSPIPQGKPHTSVAFTEEACAFIGLAAPKLPGAEKANEPVSLIVTDNGSVLLAGEDKGQQANVPIVGAKAEGGPVLVSLNRRFLLRAMKWKLKDLDIFEDMLPIVFKGAGKRLVIAPLRPDTSIPAPSKESASRTQPTPEQPNPQETETQGNEKPKEPTEEMKTTNRIEQQTNVETATEPQTPAIKLAMDQAEKIKETLKSVLSDINELYKMLTLIQREKKASEREVEQVRETLAMLQKVRL